MIATHESGAHPVYKQAVIDAGRGDTVISDAFAVCPLCATSPRARVLRVCVDAVEALDTELAGETMFGPTIVEVPKRSGHAAERCDHGPYRRDGDVRKRCGRRSPLPRVGE
jgi:nitronate monooxygenase